MKRVVGGTGWLWLLLALLIAPALAQRDVHEAAAYRADTSRAFIASGVAERNPPPPAPHEELPAKNPRFSALGVQLKRAKSPVAHSGPAALALAIKSAPRHARVIPVHAQAVDHVRDPAARLHPGQAPPAA